MPYGGRCSRGGRRRLNDRLLPRSRSSATPRGEAQLQPVAVAVESDGATRCEHLCRQRGTATNLLADHEERSSRARAREDLEHRRRPLRVGAIVECDGNASFARRQHASTPAQPQPEDGLARMHVGARGDDRARKAAVAPDLNLWLDRPALRIVHRRASRASAEQLWSAALEIELGEVGCWGGSFAGASPALAAEQSVRAAFRYPAPFLGTRAARKAEPARAWSVRSGPAARLPRAGGPEEFRDWSRRGTARVVFAPTGWQATDARLLGVDHVESRFRPLAPRAHGAAAVRAPWFAPSAPSSAPRGSQAAVRRAEGVPRTSSGTRRAGA